MRLPRLPLPAGDGGGGGALNRQRKGKNFERKTARALALVYPGAKRCLQYQAGHESPDVSAGPLWVECKAGRVSVVPVYRATRRACAAGKGPRVPAVVTTSGAGAPLVITLALSDLIKLLRGVKP